MKHGPSLRTCLLSLVAATLLVYDSWYITVRELAPSHWAPPPSMVSDPCSCWSPQNCTKVYDSYSMRACPLSLHPC